MKIKKWRTNYFGIGITWGYAYEGAFGNYAETRSLPYFSIYLPFRIIQFRIGKTKKI